MLTVRTRRNISLVLFIVLVFVSAVVWSMITDADPMKDGVYAGLATGFGGDLIVDVTINDGKISQVEVRPHEETPFIANEAIEKLTANMVEMQSANVEVVSGATVTSNAMIAAAEQALQKAAGIYQDGMHSGSADGFGGVLIADVTIGDGQITKVEVRPHEETPFIADSAIEELSANIVQMQSTDIEVISGATVTSKALLKAVENALRGTGVVEIVEEPEPEAETVTSTSTPFEINVADGTHRGSAQGFGGELVIDVTVLGGEITDIEVVESSETPFIADGALEKLLPAIIEAQGKVDVVSGATVTSNAVLEAIENALLGKAEAVVETVPFVINVADGIHRASADGFGGELVIDVTVLDQKITAIEVIESSETPFIADGALKTLLPNIIETQSKVAAVSGATVTSKAVLKAVGKAVSGDASVVDEELEEIEEVLEIVPFSINVVDGTHRASADGFGGELVIDVTVLGGKITEIEVVESSETPFIADGALKTLLPNIIETQSKVEAVSGATVTSKAVLEAIEKAVLGADEVVEVPFVINVADGTHRGSAQGFGGDFVIDVTVLAGKITEIEVVESSETPFIADGALKTLLPAILETQVRVDIVSGATVTSEALFVAIEDALTK